MELYNLTIKQAREKLSAKEISAEDLTNAFIGRIKKNDSNIGAFLARTFDKALKQAKEIDKKRIRGEKMGELAGIPMAVKDNILTEGIKTTAGSKILENYIAPYDATVFEILKNQGAILLGKTNLDEFAMGSSTENSAFQKTKNPWDVDRVPGGSSGGSAAAVAASECIFALGSDTGGSIRQPASFCGVVGLKPTYGRVSRFGLIAYGSSLDQIGPLAKNVEDAAIVLKSISGKDKFDSTSSGEKILEYSDFLKSKEKIKIGIIKEFFTKGIDPNVKKTIRSAIEKLKEIKCEVEEVSLPMTEYALPVYYLLAKSECSANLSRYDGIKYGYSADKFNPEKVKNLIESYFISREKGFGQEIKRSIMMGTYALSAGYYDAYYLKAAKVRTLIKEECQKAFQKFDCLVGPTAPTAAFKIGEKIEDPLTMYLSDIYTVPINLAGLPAISIPCGFVKSENNSELPVGLQIIGNYFDEEKILQLANLYEKATEWHFKKPKAKIQNKKIQI
jgi:aspartyl-tRNA(Asn)/glutamyl-tRNA(Gln) amidotransferase subunit A